MQSAVPGYKFINFSDRSRTPNDVDRQLNNSSLRVTTFFSEKGTHCCTDIKDDAVASPNISTRFSMLMKEADVPSVNKIYQVFQYDHTNECDHDAKIIPFQRLIRSTFQIDFAGVPFKYC